MLHALFLRKGMAPLFLFIVSFVWVSTAHAQTSPPTGLPAESSLVAPVLIGIYLILLAVVGLLVLFVDSRDFPRKESMAVVWPLTKKYFWLFAGLIVIQQVLLNLPAVVTAVIQLSLKLGNDEPISNGLNMIAALLISATLQGGMVAITLGVIDGKAVGFGMLFSQAKKLLRVFGGMLLYGLIVFGGFLLLIIPGIIWSIKFTFWLYVMIDQDKGVMESLKESSRITRGHMSSLMWVYCYLGALNTLAAMLFFVGLFVTMPITLLTIAHIYRKLMSAQPSVVRA